MANRAVSLYQSVKLNGKWTFRKASRTRHRLIEYVELFRGTIDAASVHPREVVKEALARNAAAVICCHGHPSGDATPSAADELITRRLRDALALIEVKLLDHLIVGETVRSMAELGLL